MSFQVRRVPCVARWRQLSAAFSRQRTLLAALTLVLILSALPLPAGFLTSVSPTLASPSSLAKPDTAEQSQAGSTGEALVNTALQYVGYPYVYAGASPATGFDCSGFTWYVVQATLGRDIGRGVESQWSAGTQVSYEDLQPGDLVFFANTWGPGLTHVGIYIGGGQFVHAENEMTGVVIGDLGSDYYAAHYAGAVRLG